MKFHYADWIAYTSYAILIDFENRRSKRLNTKHAKKMARK